jgi:hypothetical protein
MDIKTLFTSCLLPNGGHLSLACTEGASICATRKGHVMQMEVASNQQNDSLALQFHKRLGPNIRWNLM